MCDQDRPRGNKSKDSEAAEEDEDLSPSAASADETPASGIVTVSNISFFLVVSIVFAPCAVPVFQMRS